MSSLRREEHRKCRCIVGLHFLRKEDGQRLLTKFAAWQVNIKLLFNAVGAKQITVPREEMLGNDLNLSSSTDDRETEDRRTTAGTYGDTKASFKYGVVEQSFQIFPSFPRPEQLERLTWLHRKKNKSWRRCLIQR